MIYTSWYSRISGKLGSASSNIISGIPTHNCKAQTGVKTAKRLQTTLAHMHYAELNTNKFQRAILQYRNAPDQDTKLSPAMILFKRPIGDV